MTTGPLTPTGPWRLHISGVRLASEDPFLPIKTTQRAAYDAARAALPEGVQDAILLNERDEICETTVANIFLKRGDHYLTPHAEAGLLRGILREEMLETGAGEGGLFDAERSARGRSVHRQFPARVDPCHILKARLSGPSHLA